jgi:predicted nucleic acid-binding protein
VRVSAKYAHSYLNWYYINLAVEVEADYIVSRDKDLLDLMNDYTDEAKEFRQRFRPLKVIEPLEFLKEMRKLESENEKD